MSPLVTIGIPCFNTERWIGDAVQSALDQTWPAKEVIVVDDGSTDGSRTALAKFGSAIRLIRAEHRGGNHARNLIAENARGEWVQFLDADDYLEPPKIAQQLAETTNGENADLIYSPTWIEDSRRIGRGVSEIDPQLDLFAQWLAWQLPQTGGALWRKTTLDALGGWKEDQPCCQEHELYLRALQAGARFRFAPTPHAVYRLWSENTVCRRDPQLVVRIKTSLIDQMSAWLQARGIWTEQHQHTAGRACFEMARTFAKHDLPGAIAYARQRRERGLFHLAGPAASARYRVLHQLFGFSFAEHFASVQRALSRKALSFAA